MAAYTGVKATILLKEYVPDYVLGIIAAMLDPHGVPLFLMKPVRDFSNPLFRTSQWRLLFHSDSPHMHDEFPAESTWIEKEKSFRISFHLKDYDLGIDNFFRWVSPFVEEISGFIRHQEWEAPHELFLDGEEILIRCDPMEEK